MFKKKLKLLLSFLSLLLLFGIIYDNFFDIHSANLIHNLSYRPEWEVKKPAKTDQQLVQTILSQSFYYQSQGRQSYVFSSADNQYVLKLFQFKRFRPAWYSLLIPNYTFFEKFKKVHAAKRSAKLETVFKGHHVAYEHLKKESGLIFLQLNASKVYTPITLTDKLGFKLNLDLGETSFALQKKGKMLRQDFAELFNKNEITKIKERITKIFAIYLSEYQQGLHDLDYGVMQNFGFIGEEPFHLDIGKFEINLAYKNPKVYQVDLIKVANRMRLWIRKYYPQHAKEVLHFIEQELSDIFQSPFKFANS